MKNIPLLLLTLGGSLILLLVIVFAFSNISAKPPDTAVVLGPAQFSKGNVDATVTVVEFSDFQCPACQASQPLVAQVLQQYDDVRLVYRFFPLVSIHPNAQAAARAAIAAGTFDKFWEYHDLLFEKQQDWGAEKDPTEKLVEYAVSFGIGGEEFRQKLNDNKAEADTIISKDVQDATVLGVPGTPTFFVNGEKVTVDTLATAVEKSLGK